MSAPGSSVVLPPAPSVVPNSQPAPVRSDVRPILPRSENNIWSRIEHVRHELFDGFAETLSASRLEGLVLESNPFVVPAWVKMECWLPIDDAKTTKRVWAVITIHAKPYYDYETEFEVSYDHAGDNKHVKRVVPFGKQKAAEVARFLLSRDRKLDIDEFREAKWHFWKPENKQQDFGRDWLQTGARLMLLLFLGSFGLLFVDSRYVPVAIATGAIMAFLFYRISRRETIWRTEGKPPQEPRSLIRVDSWQVTIFGIGEQAENLKRQFIAKLDSPPVQNFRYRVENLWYWGLDGKEEREQIVLTSGRGVVFCQIYKYGKDLYVGWDGHLNSGQWVETVIGSGIDKSAHLPVKVTSVTPGTQSLIEYDVIDLSCLMEWTHAQLVRLCKDLMEEHKIDQEVDFTILRGERQGLTGGAATSVAKKQRRPLFKRTA